MKLSIMKIMALLGFAFLAAGLNAASDDVREVRRLQEKAGATTLLPLDAKRADIALALADVAATTGQQQSDLSGWNAKDSDALFALLQQYREELAALGLKQASVDLAMEALRKRVDALSERMEYLPPDGMKIHGKFDVLMDDMLFTGPGQYLSRPTRFRYFKQDVQLDFTAVKGPFLGITQVELINYVGSYTAPEPLGIRRVYAEVRTPIAVQSGDFAIKYTPLTMWRNEDEDPYVPEPYKGRSDRLHDVLLLTEDGSNYLRGLRVLTDLMLTENTALELETYITILDAAGNIAYTYADPTTGLDFVDIKVPYNTYLGAWKAAIEPFQGFRIAYNGTKIWDDPDSGSAKYDTDKVLTYTAGVARTPMAYLADKDASGNYIYSIMSYENDVHSLSAKLDLFGGFLKVEGEYALSSFHDPNVGIALADLKSYKVTDAPKYVDNADFRAGGYLMGSATNAKLTIGPKWMKLSGFMRQVDESFIAPAAQTRTLDRDRSPFGPFYTDNSLFNPNSGGFGGFTFPISTPVESQFNRRIIPPETYIATGSSSGFRFNYFIPSDVGFEAGSPYGLATPNRQGYGGELSFDLWKGVFKPAFKVDMSQQIIGEGPNMMPGASVDERRPIESYKMARGGMIVNLKPAFNWPVKLIAGYRIEDTRADAPWAPQLGFAPGPMTPAAQVAFDSTRLDLGIEYWPVPTTGLFLGYRHLDYNGTIHRSDFTLLGARGQYGVMEDYETMGGGIRYFMGDRISIDLAYTNQIFPSRDASLTFGKNVAYEMEQIFGKFTVTF